MKSRAIITWVLLVVLTIVSAVLSDTQGKYIILIIMMLAAFKFIGVAFQFMELKKAHPFWKYAILIYLIFIITVVIVQTL